MGESQQWARISDIIETFYQDLCHSFLENIYPIHNWACSHYQVTHIRLNYYGPPLSIQYFSSPSEGASPGLYQCNSSLELS